MSTTEPQFFFRHFGSGKPGPPITRDGVRALQLPEDIPKESHLVAASKHGDFLRIDPAGTIEQYIDSGWKTVIPYFQEADRIGKFLTQAELLVIKPAD